MNILKEIHKNKYTFIKPLFENITYKIHSEKINDDDILKILYTEKIKEQNEVIINKPIIEDTEYSLNYTKILLKDIIKVLKIISKLDYDAIHLITNSNFIKFNILKINDNELTLFLEIYITTIYKTDKKLKPKIKFNYLSEYNTIGTDDLKYIPKKYKLKLFDKPKNEIELYDDLYTIKPLKAYKEIKLNKNQINLIYNILKKTKKETNNEYILINTIFNTVLILTEQNKIMLKNNLKI